MDGTYDTRDVLTSLGAIETPFPLFRITDIVEVDTVNIIATGNLLTDIRDILCSLRILWIQEGIHANTFHQVGTMLAEVLCPIAFPFACWYGNHPRMQLHASLMCLFNGELQRVIMGCCSESSTDTAVPRLIVGRVGDSTSDACLKEYGIYIRLFQLVENLAKFLFLSLLHGGRCSFRTRPVETLQCGEPYGTKLLTGLCT